jgi:hypothetical protein
VNLSLGGMFVASETALPPGTAVALALEASGKQLEFAEAEVVWQAPSGFGVRFTKLRPRARALVEHLVARGGTGEMRAVSSSGGTQTRWKIAAIGALVAVIGASAAVALGVRASRARAVAAAAVAATPAPAPTALTAAAAPVEPTIAPGDYEVALPTGAVTSIKIAVSATEVAITPQLHKGAAVRHVFKLTSPPRLVIDVAGRIPRYSWQLDGNNVVKSVRVGGRNKGTRVVVDLPENLSGRTYRVVTPANI